MRYYDVWKEEKQEPEDKHSTSKALGGDQDWDHLTYLL